MKLIYKITYIDDKVEEIAVSDFAYTQEQFWVMPLKGFTRRYIKSSSIHAIEQYFKS